MRINAWQLPVTLLLIVAIGSGCGKSADSGPKAAAANAAKQADRSRDVDESIRVSEAEAQQFAEKFAAAINERNVAAAAGMFDWDETVRRATAEVDIKQEALDGFARGVKKGAEKQHLFQETVALVEQGGRFDLLRVHLGRAGRRVMFRLTRTDGGINYFDVVLYRPSDGPVKAADVYIAANGELLSESLRRMLLQMAAYENRSLLQRLSGSQADLVANVKQMQQVALHVREERFAEALAAYGELPSSLKQDKLMLVLRIAAAQNVSEVEHAAAIDDLVKYHPDDPSAGLFMIDGATLKGDLDGALAAVDRLDKSVGGDPYLDLMRANFLVEKKDYAKARQLLTKLEAWNPQLLDTQWVYVAISLAEKDHDETARRLNKVTEEFGVEIQDLTAVPEYAEFVKSPQYQQWMQSRAAVP